MNSVQNVRHALALFEKKSFMSPERFDLERIVTARGQEVSIQEAWFAGTHRNLGGSCEQDGLHRLVTEAQAFGLVIGFRALEQCDIADPAALIKIRAGEPRLQCTSHCGAFVLKFRTFPPLWQWPASFHALKLAVSHFTYQQTSDKCFEMALLWAEYKMVC